jgi:annexin A7/11
MAQYGGPPPQNYGAPPSPYGAPPPHQAYGAPPPPSPHGAHPPPNFPPPQQRPSINVTTQIQAIRKACKGLGTDEAMLIRVIGSADGPTIDAIRAGYQYTGGLIKTLESETSKNFKTALVATALGPLESLVFWANRSMAGAGTDEWMMTEALLGRTNHEMQMMKQIYPKMYRRTLENDVRADLSFKTQEFFLMAINTIKPEEWVQPNPAEIDRQTQALYAATKGRPGTDETTVSKIVTSCNEAQLRAIALQFGRLHGDIIKMIKSEFSGHMRDALIYLFRGALNKPERDAKLLEDSMKGLGTRDDHLIMRVVRIHWDRQHLANVQAAFRNMYHRELANRIQGDTSGDYCRMLLQMVSLA